MLNNYDLSTIRAIAIAIRQNPNNKTAKMNWNRNVCSAKLLIFNGGDIVRIQNLNKWCSAQLER
jgi:hypothetical protein